MNINITKPAPTWKIHSKNTPLTVLPNNNNSSNDAPTSKKSCLLRIIGYSCLWWIDFLQPGNGWRQPHSQNAITKWTKNTSTWNMAFHLVTMQEFIYNVGCILSANNTVLAGFPRCTSLNCKRIQGKIIEFKEERWKKKKKKKGRGENWGRFFSSLCTATLTSWMGKEKGKNF